MTKRSQLSKHHEGKRKFCYTHAPPPPPFPFFIGQPRHLCIIDIALIFGSVGMLSNQGYFCRIFPQKTYSNLNYKLLKRLTIHGRIFFAFDSWIIWNFMCRACSILSQWLYIDLIAKASFSDKMCEVTSLHSCTAAIITVGWGELLGDENHRVM